MGAYETMFDVCCKQIESMYFPAAIENVSLMLGLCHNLTMAAINNHRDTGVLDFEEVSPFEVGWWLNGVLFMAVVAVTAVLNPLSIFIFSTASMRSPTNLLLTFITAFDLLTCAFQVPLNIFVYFRDGYKHLPVMVWCDVYTYMHNFLPPALHSTSFLLNTCLSVQRCVGVMDITRWRAQTICSYKGTLISVLICTLLSFLVHSIHPISMGVEEVQAISKQMLSSGQLQFVQTCKVAPRYPKTFGNWLTVYIWTRVAILQLFPAAFLCICNIVLIRASYKTYAYRKRLLGTIGSIANLNQAFETEESPNEAAVASADIELFDNGGKPENAVGLSEEKGYVQAGNSRPNIIISTPDKENYTNRRTQDITSTDKGINEDKAVASGQDKTQRCSAGSRLKAFKMTIHTRDEKCSSTDNSKPEETVAWWDFLREHLLPHGHHKQEQRQGEENEDQQQQLKQHQRQQRQSKSDEGITWWDFLREHVLPHGHNHQHQKELKEESEKQEKEEEQQSKRRRSRSSRKSEEGITWWDFLREHFLPHGHDHQRQDSNQEQEQHDKQPRKSQASITWWDFLYEHALSHNDSEEDEKQPSTQGQPVGGSCDNVDDSVFEDNTNTVDISLKGKPCQPSSYDREKKDARNGESFKSEEVTETANKGQTNASPTSGKKDHKSQKMSMKRQNRRSLSDGNELRKDSQTDNSQSQLGSTESQGSRKRSGNLKTHELRSTIMLLLATSCTLVAEICVIITLIFQYSSTVVLPQNQFLSRSDLAIFVMASNVITLLTFPLNFVFFCTLSQSFRKTLRAKLLIAIRCFMRKS